MKRVGLIFCVFALFLFAQAAQAQWAPGKRICWTSGDSGFAAIAIGPSDSIHVVWEDDTPGNYEIYYSKSTDGGGTWVAAKRITATNDRSGWPSVAVDPSGGIHVTWEDLTLGHYAVYYVNSTNGGTTWSPSRRINWTAGNSYNAALASDASGYLHLAYNDDTPGNEEVFYKKSTNGGASWMTSKRLSYNSGGSGWPAISVDGCGFPHVAWSDSTPGPYEIYYKKSTDGGATWQAVKRLSYTSTGQNIYVELAVDSSDNPHLVWQGSRPDGVEIFYKKSTAGGMTWATTKKLTWTTDYYSGYPDIAVGSTGNLHLVWGEETTGEPEIYYKKSTDGGGTWSLSQRLTWTAGSSSGEAVATDSLGNVHVVWADDTPGQGEIYYKKYVK